MHGEIRRRLEAMGATALVVVAESSRDPDLAPFAGRAHLLRSAVVAPRRDGRPRLAYWSPMEREEAASAGLDLLTPEQLDLARWSREAAAPGAVLAAVLGQAFLRCGVAPGLVALAGHAPVGEVAVATRELEKDGWRFADGHGLVRLLRKKKREADVAEIRRVASGTAAAFRRVAGILAGAQARGGELWLGGERLRVARLRAEIAQRLALAGLEQPSGNIVAPAEEGAVPHNTGLADRVLAPGESLVVDLTPKGRLYADSTRTFCVGEAPEALARAHGLVREALVRAAAAAAPGVRGWDLQEIVCDLFEAAGLATQRSEPQGVRGYVHGLGHGVGYEVHELPTFKRQAKGEEGELAVGDVFTLEPGLYDPEAGYGVRLEDTVYLGASGLENLTPLPYSPDPLAWTAGG